MCMRVHDMHMSPFFLSEPGFEQFKVSERLHGNWIRLYLEENNSEVLFNLGTKVRRQYLDALRTLSLSLSRQTAQYDVYSMVVGTVVVLEVRVLVQSHGSAAKLSLMDGQYLCPMVPPHVTRAHVLGSSSEMVFLGLAFFSVSDI